MGSLYTPLKFVDFVPNPSLDAANLNYIQQGITNATNIANAAVPESVVTTKGDMLVGSGNGVVDRLGVGADGSTLVPDSTQTSGLRWMPMNARFPAENFTSGRTDLAAIQAACSAASTFSSAGTVLLSDRTWDVGNGLSMSGYTCGLVGVSAGHASGNPNGTTLHASTQAGAVLDLTGWTCPDSFQGRVEFGMFNLQGSNVADATKANIGLRRATAALGSVYIHDINITQTGGPGVDMADLYLSDMARVTVVTPVDANTNNVPYMIFRGCNGNRFDGLGFRSLSSSGDTGVGGALVITDDGTNPSVGNVWFGTWFEYLHTPTNGSLIACAANRQQFYGTYFVDCSKESGATGTAFVRFAPSAYSDSGGNTWRGYVPGNGGTATSIDTGIAVTQSRNSITGVKGYSGTNVTLTSGVGYTFVELGGAESGATNAGISDSSGQTTNVLIDQILGTTTWGTWVQTMKSSPAGPQFADAATPANGALYLGNTGAVIQATSGGLYVGDDSIYLRTFASATMLELHAASNPTAIVTGKTSGKATMQLGGVGTGLQITSGGIQRKTVTQTASYSVSWTTDDVVIANGSSITVTLPRADYAGAGRCYMVKNVNSTACTIATSNSQMIDGAASDSLAQWGVGRYMSDGSNWLKI